MTHLWTELAFQKLYYILENLALVYNYTTATPTSRESTPKPELLAWAAFRRHSKQTPAEIVVAIQLTLSTEVRGNTPRKFPYYIYTIEPPSFHEKKEIQ